MEPTEALSDELAAALLRELQRTYDWQNHERFGDKLVRPVLVLEGTRRRLGRWVSASRRLEMSLPLLLERTWPEVLSVLEHEMAHQYVDEVLRVHDEGPHGATFQRVCHERGIDARAVSDPARSDAPASEDAKALDRIRKLLALAGSANTHEAEVAMRKAQELMLRFNIDGAQKPREFEVRHVGAPRRRAHGVESAVMSLLAELFFVKVISIPVYLPREGVHARVYELAGTRANLDMAEHVHAFLMATAERLWRTHRGDARVRSGRDSLAYQLGVIAGFREKLLAERTVLRGAGLVWVRDAKLDQFYRRRNPRIVHRRSSVRLSGAHAAGKEAGRTVVLHKPVSAGTSGGVVRALPK